MNPVHTSLDDLEVRRGNSVQRWTVAHREHGIVLMLMRSRKSAEAARQRLAELPIDWTLDATGRIADRASVNMLHDLRMDVCGT